MHAAAAADGFVFEMLEFEGQHPNSFSAQHGTAIRHWLWLEMVICARKAGSTAIQAPLQPLVDSSSFHFTHIGTSMVLADRVRLGKIFFRLAGCLGLLWRGFAPTRCQFGLKW